MAAAPGVADALDVRQLFGGAITMAVPRRFVDVSQLREVPDNQEVFADVASSDQSISVELVAYNPDFPDADAGKMHFQLLAADNQAQNARLLSSEPIPPEHIPNLANVPGAKVAVNGQQEVSKFREAALNTVNIYMAVIRLPQVGTDVLITFNDPIAISAASSSAKTAVPTEDVNASLHLFRTMLQSFMILDWNLFSG